MTKVGDGWAAVGFEEGMERPDEAGAEERAANGERATHAAKTAANATDVEEQLVLSSDSEQGEDHGKEEEGEERENGHIRFADTDASRAAPEVDVVIKENEPAASSLVQFAASEPEDPETPALDLSLASVDPAAGLPAWSFSRLPSVVTWIIRVPEPQAYPERVAQKRVQPIEEAPLPRGSSPFLPPGDRKSVV